MSRFDYIAYDEIASHNQAVLKKAFIDLEVLVDHAIAEPCRAKSLIMTKLEEAYMWCGKAIRDDQLRRHIVSTAALNERRIDS